MARISASQTDLAGPCLSLSFLPYPSASETMFTIPEEQAIYCADPSTVHECVMICPAPVSPSQERSSPKQGTDSHCTLARHLQDVSAIGLRLGAYIQAISFLCLIVIAPEEAGSGSPLWVGLCMSFACVLTVGIQMHQVGEEADLTVAIN